METAEQQVRAWRLIAQGFAAGVGAVGVAVLVILGWSFLP